MEYTPPLPPHQQELRVVRDDIDGLLVVLDADWVGIAVHMDEITARAVLTDHVLVEEPALFRPQFQPDRGIHVQFVVAVSETAPIAIHTVAILHVVPAELHFGFFVVVVVGRGRAGGRSSRED